MASIKIIQRVNKPNKESKLPLCIQIIKDRKKSVIHLGQYLDPNDWDQVKQKVKKTHPNHHELNIFLLKRLTEANKKFLEIETQKSSATAKAIQRNIKSKGSSKFIGQAEIYLNGLKQSGKYNRYSADKPRIKRFIEFLEGEDISFQDITVPLLNKFKAYLKGTREITDRTIINHLVVIRTIFSQAIKDNLVESKFYPFGKDKIRIKFPESQKVSLTIEEVKKLEDAKLSPESSLNHARNLWLLSFYFAGIRISDLLRLKWSDIDDGRLSYTMGKNAKSGSLKIPEKATSILANYKSTSKIKTGFVFSDLDRVYNHSDLFEVQKKISNATKTINEALQKLALKLEIDKKLTMHIARHTFGNLSGDRISIQMLQKLYRHTSILTTIGYQSNFINQDTDEALNSVINFSD
ncbi:MAG: site-specific integrase [Saprospiraceae bacterium]|nr:site-specific integrase [Candidatus Vicinibacter affinis]